jgi:hypothetical protein
MVQDEVTMRLIDLHKYEAARKLPVCDEVYRTNAGLLLHDETCYRCVGGRVWRARRAQASASAGVVVLRAQSASCRRCPRAPTLPTHLGAARAAGAATPGFRLSRA